MSFHYLELYDAELRELRKRVKPGLVPPFYADLPGTFEEICDSERRYILAFLERPVRTQIFRIFQDGVRLALLSLFGGKVLKNICAYLCFGN